MRARSRLVATVALSTAMMASTARAEDAAAAVARYAGPQTTWEGPSSAPSPQKGKSIVYLSGDEQNDISREYGLSMKQAAEHLGWHLTVIDGHGSPATWVSGFNQAIALNPTGSRSLPMPRACRPDPRRRRQRGLP